MNYTRRIIGLMYLVFAATVLGDGPFPTPTPEDDIPTMIRINVDPSVPGGPPATRVVLDGGREKLHCDVDYVGFELDMRIAVYINDWEGNPVLVHSGLANPTANNKPLHVHYQIWIPAELSNCSYTVTVILWGPPSPGFPLGRQLSWDSIVLDPYE